MKVDGLDTDVGEESVLVGENRATCVMGHAEPTSKNVMVDLLRCLLQGDDMPPAYNTLSSGTLLSASGPWVPVVDAEPLLRM